ncbi:MAG: 50S ribosomal protein L30 [Nitrospinota bacterium]
MATRGKKASGRIKVEQVHSGIGSPKKHKETLRSLGFKRLNQVVELLDNEAVRGMIFAVRHLVEIV